MTESDFLFERAKKVIPGGVHSPVRSFRGVGGTPKFIHHAKGAYLQDIDGKKYLDFCMSWGPLLFGHQDEEIKEAVIRALNDGWSYGTTEPYSLELAELITSRLGKFGVEKIRFVSSGTEAVMSALRLARAFTGRNKILKFDGCYHGHVDSMLVKAGSGLADMASPDSAGVTASMAADTLVCPLNDIVKLKEIFEKHSNEIAAVILEPLPANNGLLLQTENWIQEVSVTAKRYGALVIFDEVISGFRVAFGGMAERLHEKMNFKPDLFTYGKVLGGGFPVGAYAGKAEIMDQIAPSGPVYQAGTLSANPVAIRAGLAMLKKLLRENPYSTLELKTEKLARSIEKAVPSLQVQNYGSIFWPVAGKVQTADGVVRRIENIPSDHKALFTRTFHKLLEKGYYLAPSAYEVGFLSTVHTDAELAGLVEAFHQSVSKVYKESV